MSRIVVVCLTVLGMCDVLRAAYTEGHHEQMTVAGGYGTNGFDVKVYPSEAEEYDIGGFGSRDIYVSFKDNEDWTSMAVWSYATDGAWSITVYNDEGTQVYQKARLKGTWTCRTSHTAFPSTRSGVRTNRSTASRSATCRHSVRAFG